MVSTCEKTTKPSLESVWCVLLLSRMLWKDANTPEANTPYIPLHDHLIALGFQLQVFDLCLQIGQRTESTAWSTRTQQPLEIFDVEDITILPDSSAETAVVQRNDPRANNRLRAICQATGRVNLVDALEGSESFSTRDVGRIFLIQLEERKADVGVLENSN